MKKLFIGATLALAASLVATPAMAAEDCVPTAAYTETVVDQAAVEPKDAVGEPTKTVPNPDYVAPIEGKDAVTHTVVHAAVTCPVSAPGASSDDSGTLAETGGDIMPLLYGLGAAGVLGIGGTALLLRRRHARIEE